MNPYLQLRRVQLAISRTTFGITLTMSLMFSAHLLDEPLVNTFLLSVAMLFFFQDSESNRAEVACRLGTISGATSPKYSSRVIVLVG